MDNRRRILFITPISHLKNFYSELHKKFKFVELLKPTYSSVKKYYHNMIYCFVAPNHQTFTIDEDLIKDSNLECIVTPSTGLNHIDVDSVPIVSIKNDEVLENIWSTPNIHCT